MRFIILRTTLLVCAAFLSGCVAPWRSSVLVFPREDVTAYSAPDGRTWLLRSKEKKPAKTSLTFHPRDSTQEKWTELLFCSESKTGWPVEEIRRLFTLITTEDDPKMKFTITEVDADTIIVVYETPRWNEKGIQKIVRFTQGHRMIAYQNRLGAAGDALYENWCRLIKHARVWDDN